MSPVTNKCCIGVVRSLDVFPSVLSRLVFSINGSKVVQALEDISTSVTFEDGIRLEVLNGSSEMVSLLLSSVLDSETSDCPEVSSRVVSLAVTPKADVEMMFTGLDEVSGMLLSVDTNAVGAED